VLTPGANTEIAPVVTLPDEFTTQWPAVTTMRLVHNAPLHELLPLRMRTTAVLPSAEVPPTTAVAGLAVTTDVQIATSATTSERVTRHTVSRALSSTPPRL